MAPLPLVVSFVFLILSILLNGLGCGTDDVNTNLESASAPYATVEWQEAAPKAVGMDSSRLQELQDYFKGFSTTSLLVVRKGTLVWEKYYKHNSKDTVFESFSATKSFTSALAGIAISKGFFRLDQPASDFIDAWRPPDPRSAVTIRDLLTMTSGLQWSYFEYLHVFLSFPFLPLTEDLVQYALGLPLEYPPGSRWTYDESALMVMSHIFFSSTGMELKDFAKTELFDPIGMDSARWVTDGHGHTYTFLGLQATSRDLARFGYLFLRRGVWEGRQLIPESWINLTTRAYRQDLNPAYGYLWWVNGYAEEWEPMEGQPMHLPATGGYYFGRVALPDTYAALGFLGQMIAVIPELDLVMVHTGENELYNFRKVFTLLCRSVVSE